MVAEPIGFGSEQLSPPGVHYMKQNVLCVKPLCAEIFAQSAEGILLYALRISKPF